jgi:catechol 2,3-dioxygenase-like lactoylglutathione lyase family enzyme
MTIQRMDNVGIVVEDLDAAIAFFTELGLELEGTAQIEGVWADRTVGLNGVRSDIATLRTPDGHSKLELTKYHTPAAVGAEPENPPPNTLGLHRAIEGRSRVSKKRCFIGVGGLGCSCACDEPVDEPHPDKQLVGSPTPAIFHVGVCLLGT